MESKFHDWNCIHNSVVNPDYLKATPLAPALNCQLYTQLLNRRVEEQGGVRPTFPHLWYPLANISWDHSKEPQPLTTVLLGGPSILIHIPC